MSITIENLPIFFLLMIGIGIIVIVIGIIRLANHSEDTSLYSANNMNENQQYLEELFSFFLQEEEKKNQDLRKIVMGVSEEENQNANLNLNSSFHKIREARTVDNEKEPKSFATDTEKYKEDYRKIIARYEAGDDIETIAKSLKKGVGEVKLVISLYAMR